VSIEFASALPPDVPAPPAARGGGVRWPDGVVRPPGELPPSAPSVLDLGAAEGNAVFAIARRLLPVTLAVGGIALAAVAAARRRRR
jgi:hypothetical protein